MSQSPVRDLTGIERGALLYDGKAKQVYETTDPDLVWIHFKDCLLYTSPSPRD